MKYLKLFFLCFLFFSCQKEDKAVERIFKEITKVRIWSYPSRTFWDIKNGRFSDRIGIKNNKIELDTTQIVDNIILDINQQSELLTLLNTDVCSNNGSEAACYEPRHLIVFYNKEDKIIGYYEFCIECGGSVCSKKMEILPQFCIEKGEQMQMLLKKFGLKIIGDSSPISRSRENELSNQPINKK